MFAPKTAEVIQEHEQEEVEDMGDYLRLCKTTEVVQEHEPEEVRIIGIISEFVCCIESLGSFLVDIIKNLTQYTDIDHYSRYCKSTFKFQCNLL